MPESNLEELFLKAIDDDTPHKVKEKKLIDLQNKNAFEFVLTKQDLLPFDQGGLGLYVWLANYEKEAMVSTAGIRGLQNPLYPWDTRYPISLVGILLATVAKSMVAKDLYPKASLTKLAASEVRYNSKLYVELISRIQAEFNIKTLNVQDLKPIPIWLVSFLIFVLDLYGGEYVTSSHAISKKIATKDINSQGSQFIPEESLKFIQRIKDIFRVIETEGKYVFKISQAQNANIDQSFLSSIGNGLALYADYLKGCVATEHNLSLIQSSASKIVVDCMGGSMYEVMDSILSSLNIRDKYDFLNATPDPFFHGIGKRLSTKGAVFDLGCDATIMEVDLQEDAFKLPVIETMSYSEKLKNYPAGTIILMVDPDGDRLVTSQIESVASIEKLKELGLSYTQIDSDRVLVVYTPNQSFLMTFDFRAVSLKEEGLWDKYDWFMIKTSASALSWDEWASFNNVPVINTPVGFKEISTIMQKVEGKLQKFPNADVQVRDVFGKLINLGKNPRLLFAGEESGGEILGPLNLIKSAKGRMAISMREKSGGEAIILTSALYSHISQKGLMLSDYLEEVYVRNQIKSKYDIRVDVKYYNENESDIAKLLAEKQEGIGKRTKNDVYFLSLALLVKDKAVTIQQVKDVLFEAFPELNFSDLESISFVGDGTYLKFSSKVIEIRPSGTDAINKAYGLGANRNECIRFSQTLGRFTGERNSKHLQLVPEDFYNSVKDLSLELLKEFQAEDLDTELLKYIP